MRRLSGGVAAHDQVTPPSFVVRRPPGASAPPAPRFAPSQPRVGLAKSGPARCPYAHVSSRFGSPRLFHEVPPSVVRKSSYFWHVLDVQYAPSKVRSQAIVVEAASRLAKFPDLVLNGDVQVAPPSLVARTSTP